MCMIWYWNIRIAGKDNSFILPDLYYFWPVCAILCKPFVCLLLFIVCRFSMRLFLKKYLLLLSVIYYWLPSVFFRFVISLCRISGLITRMRNCCIIVTFSLVGLFFWFFYMSISSIFPSIWWWKIWIFIWISRSWYLWGSLLFFRLSRLLWEDWWSWSLSMVLFLFSGTWCRS